MTSEGNKCSYDKAQPYPSSGGAACLKRTNLNLQPSAVARCLRVIRKGDRHVMQVTRLVLAAVAVMFVVASPAGAQVKPPDPRVCPANADPSETPKFCAYAASIQALKKSLGARMQLGGFDADITCKQASASMLVWRCSWKGGPIVGNGVIRFNRLTFKPSLVVVSNVCTQPITGDITWHGCTKVLPNPNG